jgi:dihydrofolate synthase/folylpolyglutamate synthase
VSAETEIARLVASYPGRGPRASLDAVFRLRQRLAESASRPVAVAVVGTNGKTSTSTYLARMLTAGGRRTGLYTSPHLSRWTERVRVNDAPCDPDELLRALLAIDEAARAAGAGELAELRFFDVLTFAAERIFAAAGVEVAVFEAGIGGRLDAVRTLEPGLVLLTGVALDHAEILGEELSEILTDKLLVAPAGATVLSFRLGAELEARAEEVATAGDFRISWLDAPTERQRRSVPELPDYLASAFVLAGAAAGRLSASASPGTVDLHLPGRFEAGNYEGVPYLLDAAHNEAAWNGLAAELAARSRDLGPAPSVALISVSPGKRRAGLTEALRALPGLSEVIVTGHESMPAEDAGRVAGELATAGLSARAVEGVENAVAFAFRSAAAVGGRVVVFGSTHLVGEVRDLLRHTPQSVID